jgi:hypothetical protein
MTLPLQETDRSGPTVESRSCSDTDKLNSNALTSRHLNDWRGQGDEFRTLLGDLVSALPQNEFPIGLNL